MWKCRLMASFWKEMVTKVFFKIVEPYFKMLSHEKEDVIFISLRFTSVVRMSCVSRFNLFAYRPRISSYRPRISCISSYRPRISCISSYRPRISSYRPRTSSRSVRVPVRVPSAYQFPYGLP